MASEGYATPSLAPSLPQIVVTEPSPLNRFQSVTSLVEKSESEIPSQSVEREADPPVEREADPPVEKVETPLASEENSELCDSTGEFSPAPDCEQCVVLVPEVDGGGSRVNITDEERSTTETDIDGLRSNSRCCPECGGFARSYYRLSALTETNYVIPVWILLMALPISAGFFGARYLNDCKFSPTTPPLMFLMGLSGMIMITARIIYIAHKATWEHAVRKTCLYAVIVITFFLTFILFCTELMVFWRYTPSFDENSPNYCNPTFYKFTFWINCTTVLVSILMLIIRIPVCFYKR